MASPNERRQTMRVEVNGNLNIETVSAGQSLRLADVGMGGFAVRSMAPLPIDAVTSYRFTTPDGKWAAVLRARTLHCSLIPASATAAQHYLSGLAFVNTGAAAVNRQLIAMMDYAMNFVSFS